MRISDYIRNDLIYLDVEAGDKEEAIRKTVNLMKRTVTLSNAAKFLQEINQRESLGSTAIGRGVALPHARTQHVEQIIIAMTRLKEGVDFGAEDGKPVELIFTLGTPLKTVSEYLKVLANLSKLLRSDKIRKKLLKADTPLQVRQILESADHES